MGDASAAVSPAAGVADVGSFAGPEAEPSSSGFWAKIRSRKRKASSPAPHTPSARERPGPAPLGDFVTLTPVGVEQGYSAGDSSDEAAPNFISLAGNASSSSNAPVPATPAARAPPSDEAPWARPPYPQKYGCLLRLHEEIIDFCGWLQPTESERASREDLIQRMRGVVSSVWPEDKVSLHVFGSTATGLHLPTSDVDMVVLGIPLDARRSQLYALQRAVEAKHIATDVEVIPKARVPIIKFVDTKTGVHVDVCFEQQSGLQSADYIKSELQDLPILKPLVLVLKFFLAARELNETYSGGVGSFMLQMMIIAHLRIAAPDLDRGWAHRHKQLNLGAALFSFFQFFGGMLNYATVGLRVGRDGSAGLYRKHEKGFLDSKRPWLLSIQNPLDEKHDIGANSYNIGRVRKAFAHARALILADAVNGGAAADKGSKKSRDAIHQPTLLARILGGSLGCAIEAARRDRGEVSSRYEWRPQGREGDADKTSKGGKKVKKKKKRKSIGETKGENAGKAVKMKKNKGKKKKASLSGSKGLFIVESIVGEKRKVTEIRRQESDSMSAITGRPSNPDHPGRSTKAADRRKAKKRKKREKKKEKGKLVGAKRRKTNVGTAAGSAPHAP